jgi:hypothetical protein
MKCTEKQIKHLKKSIFVGGAILSNGSIGANIIFSVLND